MELTLATPAQYVARVGPVMAKRLEKLGIKTVEDLLYHVPFRYDDFSIISPIARVQPGEVVTIQGVIESIKLKYTKSGKKLIEGTITDDTGSLSVIWFNQPFLIRVLPEGSKVRLAGKIDWFGHTLVMSSPSYEVVISQPQGPALSVSIHTGRLVPVYPETDGVSSKWLRGRIDYCLQQVLNQVTDPLPSIILQSFHLISRTKALSQIHFPDHVTSSDHARYRLGFDELFMYQLHAYEQRKIWEETMKSYPIRIDQTDVECFIQSLPFTLTSDQLRATQEILGDLTRPYPMNRLLEGDVGSGKTVVAALAMYCTFRNGLSSVLMAPTQILAEQHFQTISSLLKPYAIHIKLITSNTEKSSTSYQSTKHYARNTKHSALNSKHYALNTQTIYIGTHALLYEDLEINNLGLLVIDEQQRFGVDQRNTLMKISPTGKTPHILTMTATPIPRTVARVLFGNIDLSVLHEMPKGRQKIKTWVVPNEKRDRAYAWITKQLREDHTQAFIICPLIDDSETMQTVKAVKTEYIRLKSIFPKFRLGLLHGRLKAKEKTEILTAFRNHTIDIIVATPVVEVGIDVPNATIMVIEGAERFGLSQLHQLRGRVGRGTIQSYCLLFTQNHQELTLERLKVLETSFSGPDIAQKDLELRGPGEVFGTKQHGIPPLKIASYGDKETIEATKKAVQLLIEKDPRLVAFPLLRDVLKKSTIESTVQD